MFQKSPEYCDRIWNILHCTLCDFLAINTVLFNVNTPSQVPFVRDVIRAYSVSFLCFAINSLYIFYSQPCRIQKLLTCCHSLRGFVSSSLCVPAFPILECKWCVDCIHDLRDIGIALYLSVFKIYCRENQWEMLGILPEQTK